MLKKLIYFYSILFYYTKQLVRFVLDKMSHFIILSQTLFIYFLIYLFFKHTRVIRWCRVHKTSRYFGRCERRETNSSHTSSGRWIIHMYTDTFFLFFHQYPMFWYYSTFWGGVFRFYPSNSSSRGRYPKSRRTDRMNERNNEWISIPSAGEFNFTPSMVNTSLSLCTRKDPQTYDRVTRGWIRSIYTRNSTKEKRQGEERDVEKRERLRWGDWMTNVDASILILFLKGEEMRVRRFPRARGSVTEKMIISSTSSDTRGGGEG